MNAANAMTAQDKLRQAIELMQDGETATAVVMLNRLLEDADLDDKGRAAAYVWLAESREDTAFKIHCLERALEHEPANRQIRQGLEQLRIAPAGPSRPPAPGHADLDEMPRVIGVLGGLNGLASGVFVHSAGLVASTSYALGGAEKLTVTLNEARHLPGRIIRRFPAQDLALIKTPVKLARAPVTVPPALVADHASFVALGYGGVKLRGALQRTHGGRAGNWLRTTIPPAQMPDAGGNPLYDDRGHLLGILTRNVDAAGCALAITTSCVLALAEGERRDRQLMPNTDYCRQCGGRTRARRFGGRHCETCGAAQPIDKAAVPQGDKLAALYGEDAGQPCSHCGARAGHYEGRCLRCGRAQAGAALARM